MASAPIPTDIKLLTRPRALKVEFSDTTTFDLPAEYLRVFSPSAEVQGHGSGEGALVTGKEAVSIVKIEPIGRYAVRLIFDDGHDTGLYTWPILYDLGKNYEAKWRRYLVRLEEAGQYRAAVKSDDEPEQEE